MDIIEHCHIEFVDGVDPIQHKANFQVNFNAVETEIINKEIDSLLENGAIVQVSYQPYMCLSPIFVRPKKNGEYRVILNLKKLNEYVEYHHFKMDSFEKAVALINKNMYMASVDLRHAYHSISIAQEHQKFLCFKWGDKIFQHTCLPFGLASAPRLFTKIMKPVFSKLRNLGYVSIGYIDDSLFCGDTVEE